MIRFILSFDTKTEPSLWETDRHARPLFFLNLPMVLSISLSRVLLTDCQALSRTFSRFVIQEKQKESVWQQWMNEWRTTGKTEGSLIYSLIQLFVKKSRSSYFKVTQFFSLDFEFLCVIAFLIWLFSSCIIAEVMKEDKSQHKTLKTTRKSTK